MTEIMPFPENNYETVLLDRPFRDASFYSMDNLGLNSSEYKLPVAACSRELDRTK